MSPEYSRDGEPMRLRDGVGFGDNYYYQMVSYIRKFKGIHAPATVNGGSMDIHAADIAAQWKNVTRCSPIRWAMRTCARAVPGFEVPVYQRICPQRHCLRAGVSGMRTRCTSLSQLPMPRSLPMTRRG